MSGFSGPASAQTTRPDIAMRGVIAIFAKKNCQVIIVKLESGISRLTRHAETFEIAILVQAGSFVETRIAVAFIDVVLPPKIES